MVRRSKRSGEAYAPTLKAPQTIDAENDCVALRDAMKGLGTDECAIVEILGHRTIEQRLEIKEKYKASFGKDLMEKLDGELSGHFKQLVHMLLLDSATVNARALYESMKGAGTKESVIVEILCTATNDEINQIKQAYKAVLMEEGVSDLTRTLESDLEGDLGGHFKHLVIALLQGKREELTDAQQKHVDNNGTKSVVNMIKVEEDVAAIYDAGAGKLGTDEATFIKIIASRSTWHLKAIADVYELKAGTSLIEAIDSETSGDFCDALKLTVSSCISRSHVYSDLLKQSMEGLGTKDSTLMRIIVTRCEIDLKDIKSHFESEQGKPLEEWIKEDTSGDYEKLLLTLLGAC